MTAASYVRLPRRLRPLLDTGRPALWTPERRRHLGRCPSCEFRVEQQGHDRWCPADDAATATPAEPKAPTGRGELVLGTVS